MIRPHRDPAEMTAQERLAQIGAILGDGYVRLCVARSRRAQQGVDSDGEALALTGEVEAQCGSVVHNPESNEDAA